MQSVADDLRRVLLEALPQLEAFGEQEAAALRPGGRWNRKQILGHLVDSAANNHQRFVRAQLAAELVFPGYEQDAWVATQDYGGREWRELVELWRQLNLHLAHVIARIPAERLATPCRIGSGEPVTLEFVARDYVRHLRHHLEQILAPDAARGGRHDPFAPA